MRPLITTGINSEPIKWELVSHIHTDGTDKYEYYAPPQYENRKYHLLATENQQGEAQHYRILL